MSKAYLAHAVGSKDGLSSEWAYALRTLPAGFAINLRDSVRRGDASRLGHSAAIVGGLAVATTGYGAGLLRAIKRRLSGDEPLHLHPASS
jgi:hypothetical protein